MVGEGIRVLLEKVWMLLVVLVCRRSSRDLLDVVGWW